MRILQVNKFYYRRGGDCIVALRTEEMLRQHGHEVAVFAMSLLQLALMTCIISVGMPSGYSLKMTW